MCNLTIVEVLLVVHELAEESGDMWVHCCLLFLHKSSCIFYSCIMYYNPVFLYYVTLQIVAFVPLSGLRPINCLKTDGILFKITLLFLKKCIYYLFRLDAGEVPSMSSKGINKIVLTFGKNSSVQVV